jgi:hypothetical protein
MATGKSKKKKKKSSNIDVLNFGGDRESDHP